MSVTLCANRGGYGVNGSNLGSILKDSDGMPLWISPKLGCVYMDDLANGYDDDTATGLEVLQGGNGGQVADTAFPGAGYGAKSLQGVNSSAYAIYHDKEDAFSMSDGEFWFECRVRFEAIADGTNDFLTHCGFANITGYGQPTNGIFFEYDNAALNGNFYCTTINGGTATQTDSGITIADDTWYKLKIHATSTSVAFYIDGSLVATNTTNITTNRIGRHVGFGKNTSVGTRYLYVDYIYAAVLLDEIR